MYFLKNSSDKSGFICLSIRVSTLIYLHRRVGVTAKMTIQYDTLQLYKYFDLKTFCAPTRRQYTAEEATSKISKRSVAARQTRLLKHKTVAFIVISSFAI